MSLYNEKSQSWTLLASSKGDSEVFTSPNIISIRVVLEGPRHEDWLFLAIFDGQIVLESKWVTGHSLESDTLGLDLMDLHSQQLLADNPLMFILRTSGSKISKDLDPLLNIDNYAGAAIDLLPLVLGEDKIYCRTEMVLISSGERSHCYVQCFVKITNVVENSRIPLTISLLSAHCLPAVKDGTSFLAAIGLHHIHDPSVICFGMSLSNTNATKLIWSSAINAGHAAKTMFDIPNDDKFIPKDFKVNSFADCNSVYWNSMRRVLVKPVDIENWLLSPLFFEIAGVPKLGKIEVRGRYMCFIDAGVLLEPGQYGVTTCAKLLFFNECELPHNIGPLLELPPISAKISARESNFVFDEYGHNAHIVIRFDLYDPLIPKLKMSTLYDRIGFPMPEKFFPIDVLEVEQPQDNEAIDIRHIRKEGGAFAIHKELTRLAYHGIININQNIKKTAAKRLLLRLKAMLKQFAVDDSLLINWQDAVTSQHAACRRAVTASFEPQASVISPSKKCAAARCRQADDMRLADMHIDNNIKLMGKHPQPLLIKALRLLENNDQLKARNSLLQALNLHIRSKFLLWTFGGHEFIKGFEGFELSSAAFRIALKGDSSDGVSNAIGWAALHALNHYHENIYVSFIAAKRMRKSYELPRDWKLFYERWIETSGAEESVWFPITVSSESPLLIAAAFFLCLRCFRFTDILLECYKNKCDARGSKCLQNEISVDALYIQAASFIIRRQYENALLVVNDAVKRFGPLPKMSQLRAICLAYVREWDAVCEAALLEAEKAGAEYCPLLLLRAAKSCVVRDPHLALQRAARVHQNFPSGHSALIIGRAYGAMGENNLAERWASVAVNIEPMLADGWAFLAILATYQRNSQKARAMLRTAKQVSQGHISPDLDEELKKILDAVPIEALPDSLVKYICHCDYY